MKRNCFRWGMGIFVLVALTVTAGAVDAPVEIKLTKEPEADIRRDATVAAVERVLSSVVNIATTEPVQYGDDFYSLLMRDFYPKEQLNLGSGVIIDEDGYILTNRHVVRRATRVQVKLSDGRVFDAEPVIDSQKSDVALLKLIVKTGEKFKAIKFAKDDDLLLGETVIALGNPFGLGGSVSRGILSSKNRRPTTGDEPLNVGDWLQTDAAINPGNSGGPLVNLRGELIGLNVAVYRQGQGISFAIPVKQVASAIAGFFSPEGSSMWFGAKLKTDFSPLTIAEVQPDSPAAKAGLKAGMRIAEVNGQKPRTIVDFGEQTRAAANSESHEVTLVVFSEGVSRSVKVGLVPFESVVKRRTGLTLEEITPQAASRLGLRDDKGLLIISVESGSPADIVELRAGMLLTSIDGTGVNALRDFGGVVAQKGRDEPAHLQIIAFKQIGGRYVQPLRGTVDLKLRNP